MTTTSQPVVSVEDLTVVFGGSRAIGSASRGTVVRALEDISIDLREDETLALVGESGSGKTTLGRAVVGLQPPTRGSVRLRGQPLAGLLRRDFARTRRRLQIVFQDPTGSLTPWLTVGDAICEPLLVHRLVDDRADARRWVVELLELVGLRPEHADRRPRELSGGQRQRVTIARALAVAPDVLVCDEITSGLDASIRARVINLLTDLRRQLHLTYVFITHDLHVARVVADRIAVLQEGRMVEYGPAAQVFDQPQHPYTQSLLAAQPTLAGACTQRHRPVGDIRSTEGVRE